MSVINIDDNNNDDDDDVVYEPEPNSVADEPTDAERDLAETVGVFNLRRPWQAGDWSCSLCKYHCLAADLRCKNPAIPRCGGIPPAPRRTYGADGERTNARPRIGNEWICRFPHCGAENFGSKTKCYKCKIPRDPQSIPRDELRELVRKFREGRRREQLARPGNWTSNGVRQSVLESSSNVYRQHPYGQ